MRHPIRMKIIDQQSVLSEPSENETSLDETQPIDHSRYRKTSDSVHRLIECVAV